MMKFFFFLFTITFLLFSCHDTTYRRDNREETEVGSVSNYEVSDETDHTDPDLEYNENTESSSSYNYNYDISGTDENGNNVNGNIEVSGKYGSGTIEYENGNEKNIDVEWVGKGELEGTDEDGNSYQLEVE